MTTQKTNMTTTTTTTTTTITSQERDQQQQQGQIDTATALLSISGPCRSVGDVYLTCVATAGLGMCRSWRATFERCAKQTRDGYGMSMLRNIANSEMCSHIDNTKEEDKLMCATAIVNQQLMQSVRNIGGGSPSDSQS